MSFLESNRTKRWYDEHPQMVQAIDLLEHIQPECRLAICREIIFYTENNNLLGSSEELRSLGYSRILNFIQSKSKRRWYDQQSEVHKAVNNLLLMSDKSRAEVAFRVVVASRSISKYIEQAQEQLKLVDPQEVEQLTVAVFQRNFFELTELTEEKEGKIDAGVETITLEESDSVKLEALRELEDAQMLDEDDGGMRVSAMLMGSE